MNPPDTPCALTRGLAGVGDRWSMLVLRDVAQGLTRFDQLRVSLAIAPNILTSRLRALTEAGVLARHRYSERPPRDEYRLTEAGRDFLPVLYAISEWGRTHGGDGPVSRLVDVETGRVVEPEVVDRATGARLADRALRIAMPGDRAVGDG